MTSIVGNSTISTTTSSSTTTTSEASDASVHGFVRIQGSMQNRIRAKILQYAKSNGYTKASFAYEYYKTAGNHTWVKGTIECSKDDRTDIHNVPAIRPDAFFLYLRKSDRRVKQYEAVFTRLLERYRPEGAVIQTQLAIEVPTRGKKSKRYYYDYVVDIGDRRVCIEIAEEHNARSRMAADQAKYDYAKEHGWEYHFLNVHTSNKHPLHEMFHQLNDNTGKARVCTYYDGMQEWICTQLFHVEYTPDPDPEVTCTMI